MQKQVKKKTEEAFLLQIWEVQARQLIQATPFLYKNQQPMAEAPTSN